MNDLDTRLARANPVDETDLTPPFERFWPVDASEPSHQAWARLPRRARRPHTRATNPLRADAGTGSRRRLARVAAVTLAAVVAFTGTALAAGSALGIIDLGGDATATQVTTLPVWNSTTGTFESGTATGQYIYEFAGLGADVFSCGGSTPDEATFLTSNQSLSQSDLEKLLDPSAPLGLVPLAQQKALGVINEESGCFPASVAGPLGTPQTPAQKAAAAAFTQQVLQQAQPQGFQNASSVVVHGSRLRYVTVIHNGKRTILKISRSKVGGPALGSRP